MPPLESDQIKYNILELISPLFLKHKILFSETTVKTLSFPNTLFRALQASLMSMAKQCDFVNQD